MDLNFQHCPYDLAKTAFFPLTGNPTGFHHLLLAECVLRQFAHVEQVVFILSNGKHPDPTKAAAIASQTLRKEILQKAIWNFGLPSKSYLAKVAPDQQECFKLNEKTGAVSTAEFACHTPVALFDHVVALLKSAKSPREQRVQLVMGGDLVSRMRNPQIFNALHLQGLAQHCRFLMAPRSGFDLDSEAHQLEKARHLALDYQKVNLALLPQGAMRFFQLSSTLIRRATQAHHALTCFLPEPAATVIEKHELYRPAWVAPLNEWQAACRKQEQLLEATAFRLKNLLDERHKQGLPHCFAFVETSTGGRLTAALAGLPGISQHFKESAILYDSAAKNRLLHQNSPRPAVSQEMAMQLAKAFQNQTEADFVLCESGMAGPPDGTRHSEKQGLCEMVLLAPEGALHQSHQSNPFLTKKEHQLIFATKALQWLVEVLQSPFLLESHPMG